MGQNLDDSHQAAEVRLSSGHPDRVAGVRQLASALADYSGSLPAANRAPLSRGLLALMLSCADQLLGRVGVCALQRLLSLLRYPAALCCCILIPAGNKHNELPICIRSHSPSPPPQERVSPMQGPGPAVLLFKAAGKCQAAPCCVSGIYTSRAIGARQGALLESLQRAQQGSKHALVALLHGGVLLAVITRALWHRCLFRRL